MTNPLLLGPVLGAVAADRVRIWLRARAPSPWYLEVEHQGEPMPVWVQRRETRMGHVAVFQVLGLRPRQAYTFTLRPHPQGPVLAQGRFRTAPPLARRAAFAFGLVGTFMPQHPAGQAILPVLQRTLADQDVDFLLLLGNQICADAAAHNGLGRVPANLTDYRALYAQAWGHPLWKEVLGRWPVFPIWGHREVDWGWEWTDLERTTARLPLRVRLRRLLRRAPREVRRLSRSRVVAAMRAYWEHQGLLTPPLLTPPEGATDLGHPLLLPTDRGHFGYLFHYGAAAFYVLDVHFHRIRSPYGRRLLPPQQWKTLENWLASAGQAYPLKFLVSPAAVFHKGPGDTWHPYHDELRRLLHLIVARGVQGLVILSHGLNLGRVVEARLVNDVTVWEIGIGGLTPEGQPGLAWRVRPVFNPLIRALRVHARLPGPQFGWVRVTWEPTPTLTWHLQGLAGALQGVLRFSE